MTQAQDPRPRAGLQLPSADLPKAAHPMTPAQKQLVQASFARLAPSADDVGEMFYRELFLLVPSLRKLFKSDIAQQGRNLMGMLSTGIANLNQLESIAPALRDLGRRHAEYGVDRVDYQIGTRALITTLEKGLGSDFTPALRDAWTSCYRVLSGEMMAGASECRNEAVLPEAAPNSTLLT